MAGRFNLDDYQTVKERKDLFKQDHPEGVVLPILITNPEDIEKEAAYIVPVWRTDDGRQAGAERLAKTVAQCGNIDLRLAVLIMAPDAIGTAYENRGMTGASKTSWTENAEESAIGRALDNIGYHGNGKCSREEILKAKEAEQIQTSRPKKTPKPKAKTPQASPADKAKLIDEMRETASNLGWDEETLETWVHKRTGCAISDVTYAQAQALAKALSKERARVNQN